MILLRSSNAIREKPSAEKTYKFGAKLQTIILTLALSVQCLADELNRFSGLQIEKDYTLSWYSPILGRRRSRKLVQTWIKKSPEMDTRLLALAWMESRIYPEVERGDSGRACGIYQIHARYSFPQFRRKKRAWSEWNSEEKKISIEAECVRLESSIEYSMDTQIKFLRLMDQKDLHPCHHNSGIYAKGCNNFYAGRYNIIESMIDEAVESCSAEEKDVQEMAMMKTGAPVVAVPSEKIRGYQDAMSGKEPQSQDSVYLSGYELAVRVKKGEVDTPSWA